MTPSIIWITTVGTSSSSGFALDRCEAWTLSEGVTVEEWDATTAEADHFQTTGQPPQREPDRVLVGTADDAS